MALAKSTSQRPGSVVASRQVLIEDFYVKDSNVDFSFVQPKGTILETVHAIFDGLTTISDEVADADADLTIGTNSDFTGTEVLGEFVLVDYSNDPSLQDAKVMTMSANISAGMKRDATTEDRVLYGRIVCGDGTVTGTNKVRLHFGFRHF